MNTDIVLRNHYSDILLLKLNGRARAWPASMKNSNSSLQNYLWVAFNNMFHKFFSSKLWSPQLWTQFKQLRIYKPEEVRAWTRDLAIPVRRSNQMSYEATDVRSLSFVRSNEPVRNECEVIYMKCFICRTVACVASVSVRFRSKERPRNGILSFDHARNETRAKKMKVGGGGGEGRKRLQTNPSILKTCVRQRTERLIGSVSRTVLTCVDQRFVSYWEDGMVRDTHINFQWLLFIVVPPMQEHFLWPLLKRKALLATK